jgi:hypothetical protein
MAIKPGWQLNQGTRTPPGGRVRRPGYYKLFTSLEKMGARQGPSNPDRTCLAGLQLYAPVQIETFAPCKYDRHKLPSEICYCPLILGPFTGRIFCSMASPLSA